MKVPLLAAFVLIGFETAAQQQEPARIIADKFEYGEDGSSFRAIGNVLVGVGEHRLSADEIRYDGTQIIVMGKLVYSDGVGTRIIADGAKLSDDFADGAFDEVYALLGSKLQIVADQAVIHNEAVTSFDNSAVTACQVCENGEIPLWHVRSASKIHSKETQQIYLRDALFYIRGIPVFYLPWLSFPSPEVKRQDGFLPPTFRTSRSEGTSVTVPYYKTLGPYADVTLSPYISSRRRLTLAADYRQRFRNGSLDVSGSLSRDRGEADELRSYARADGKFRLPADYILSFSATGVSDSTYLDDFGISSDGHLTNQIQLERRKGAQFFLVERNFYKPLINRNTRFQPSRSTYFEVEQRLRFAGGFGSLQLESEVIDEALPAGKIMHSAATVSWDRRWNTGFGPVLSVKGRLRASIDRQNTQFTSGPTRSSMGGDIVLAAVWPLVRSSGRFEQIMEPMAQIVWSSPESGRPADSGRSYAVLDDTSLYSIDRLPGLRDRERGLRLNLGMRHTVFGPESTVWEFFAGRVFRRADLGQFSEASGLSGVESDTVAAMHLTLAGGFRYSQNLLIGNDGGIRATEALATLQRRQFDVSVGYLDAERDLSTNMTSDARSVAMTSEFRINRSWSALIEAEYDIMKEAKRSAELNFRYRNECATATVTLGHSLAAASGGADETTLGLTVQIGNFTQKGTRLCGQVFR